MKKFYLPILLLIAISQAACGAEGGSPLPEEVAVQNTQQLEGALADFELTEKGKDFLKNICKTVADFDSTTQMDETFWQDFLFFSYTGLWGDGIEIVQVPRADLGFDEDAVKVSIDEAQAYAKLVFGVELPDIQPAFEDMKERQTTFFYQDGFYYVGVSDFPDYQFNFADCTVSESGASVTVTYSIDSEGESNVGTVLLTLAPADNENGFIVTAKNQKLFQ